MAVIQTAVQQPPVNNLQSVNIYTENPMIKKKLDFSESLSQKETFKVQQVRL
jgi:hypothetical protein